MIKGLNYQDTSCYPKKITASDFNRNIKPSFAEIIMLERRGSHIYYVGGSEPLTQRDIYYLIYDSEKGRLPVRVFVHDDDNKFVEVYNTGDEVVSLRGFSVNDAGAPVPGLVFGFGSDPDATFVTVVD